MFAENYVARRTVIASISIQKTSRSLSDILKRIKPLYVFWRYFSRLLLQMDQLMQNEVLSQISLHKWTLQVFVHCTEQFLVNLFLNVTLKLKNKKIRNFFTWDTLNKKQITSFNFKWDSHMIPNPNGGICVIMKSHYRHTETGPNLPSIWYKKFRFI